MFSWQSVDEAGRLRLKSNDFRDAQPLPRLRAFYLLSYLPASPDHLSIGFRPTWTGRFNSVNCCRDSFHRVALATLEHAVLESSDAGVYTLQIHAFPTGRAARTFCRRQLRQSTSHGCTPSQLRLYEYIQYDVGVYTVSDWNSNFCDCVPSSMACGPRSRFYLR
jgi:hypothetical protein